MEALNKYFMNMKSLFKSVVFILLFCLSFVLSCQLPPNASVTTAPSRVVQYPVGQQTVIGQPSAQTFIGQPSGQTNIGQPFRSNNNNDNRDSDRYSSRRDSCSEEKKTHSCYELCREMYTRDRDKCERETPDEIEALYDVYKDIEKIDFKRIDLDNFKNYLNASTSGLESILRDYKRSDAEEMLVWIAENSDVADIVESADDKFRILNDLLSTMVRFDSSTVDEPFTREINTRGDTLMDYALSFKNTEALNYFFEYVLWASIHCNNNNNVSVDCLTVICLIGKGSDERDRSYYFDSHVFERFMEDIIKEGTNASDKVEGNKWVKGSGDEKIDRFNDLNSSWAGENWNPPRQKPVCGGLSSDTLTS